MSATYDYWTFISINNTRRRKRVELKEVRRFFQDNFSGKDFSEIAIQRQLFEQLQGEKHRKTKLPTPVELCLRCIISSIVEKACFQLEARFGNTGGFTHLDLFPFVLNDVDPNYSLKPQIFGNPTPLFTPLAADILRTFDPERSSLSTWTNRLVKQERSLNGFLLEQGVYQVSDWAILNDTNSKQLQRILQDFYQFAQLTIERHRALLASYHAVYRRDRVASHQTNRRCSLPTLAQLQRIARHFERKTGRVLSPETLLFKLQTLADWLRQYRLHQRGSSLPTLSLDNPNLTPHTPVATPSDSLEAEFLTLYRQQFIDSLDRAIAQVLEERIARLQNRKPPKSKQFIAALQLFHCQGFSMNEIAQAVGLKAQYQVSRLLALKQIRDAIANRTLQLLRDRVLESALNYTDPEKLQALRQHLEIVLHEEINATLQEAAIEAELKNKQGSLKSLFACRVCHYFHEIKEPFVI
ncbi:hypothetical protein IQ249_17970 [Lusitaniella coriacea LEGE 07157]|uniref:Uncharacterized protein n=1 Tax=Lusitaniella coriacea LEGE 07157 TaxID=945747 RepID=A0A8J7DYG9_9CYAN|nr:hypothetical protein [Lusitaniella coriacea]MBE9117789.1 hypothetical protein [Lusitaniella coriacea LEGE 07157]